MKKSKSKILLCFFIAACSFCFADDMTLKEGDPLHKARKELINSGWSPIVTYEKMDDGTLRKSLGDAKKIHADGIPEIETCSGAGVPFCSFNYRRGGDCLQVVTIGEYEGKGKPLSIHHWNSIDCQSLSVAN